jgi:hypothetical protein
MSRIKVLNVAEKNDAAKNIAALLSNGNANRVRMDITIQPSKTYYISGGRVNNMISRSKPLLPPAKNVAGNNGTT